MMKKEIFSEQGQEAGLALKLAGRCHQHPLQDLWDPKHAHSDLWQMDLCEQGEAQLYVGSMHFHLHPGAIVIISPGLPHQFKYLASQEFVCWSFKFQCCFPKAAPRIMVAEETENLQARLAIVSAVVELCRGFFPATLLDSKRTFVVTELFSFTPLLESLLESIVKRWFYGQEPGGQEGSEVIRKISAFVRSRGGTNVSVAELARYLGYSTGHLRRLVHDHLGLSTKQFIDGERMKIARKILAYSDVRVKELADMMGFRDVKYFSRLFRKYAGVSPRRQAPNP